MTSSNIWLVKLKQILKHLRHSREQTRSVAFYICLAVATCLALFCAGLFLVYCFNTTNSVYSSFPKISVSDNFQRGGVFNITVLGTEDCGRTQKIRGQDTLTCNPVNVTVCESGKVATEAVQKICALDMGNSRIQQIGEDGNVMPDVMPHTMIVEGIRHEAERVLFGILRQLVLSNFNAPAKRYIVPILAFEGEEVNAAHLILECNAGTGLKYKYSSGVIVNFKSGVYAGSYYL